MTCVQCNIVQYWQHKLEATEHLGLNKCHFVKFSKRFKLVSNYRKALPLMLTDRPSYLLFLMEKKETILFQVVGSPSDSGEDL